MGVLGVLAGEEQQDVPVCESVGKLGEDVVELPDFVAFVEFGAVGVAELIPVQRTVVEISAELGDGVSSLGQPVSGRSSFFTPRGQRRSTR